METVGCNGAHVPGHTVCLAHVDEAGRDAYLASLVPGADVDHGGTTFTSDLLSRLLDALRDLGTGQPHFGDAGFDGAVFTSNVNLEGATFTGGAEFHGATFADGGRFDGAVFTSNVNFVRAEFTDRAGFTDATFSGTASFDDATFSGSASFDDATFSGTAGFTGTTFTNGSGFIRTTFTGDTWFTNATIGYAKFFDVTFAGNAWFNSALFTGDTQFEGATFAGGAWFDGATFASDAWFDGVTFTGDTRFDGATFAGDARFEEAVFEQSANFGPLVCAGRVMLSWAAFDGPVTLTLAARRLECQRTRWSSTAEMRLRYATVDFSYAVFEHPLTIATEADPFPLPGGALMHEQVLAGASSEVRLASLRGVDAAHLVLADIDLAECLFAGTVHLDQVRLEGACTFDAVPPGMHWVRRLPLRFTQRRTLAEEHHWRARRPAAARGWNTALFGAGRVGPTQLAPVYRALRKALEDGKDEPGAADFYYGECEMRRHDTGRPLSERALLTAYWALSGYGLRALRALAWLGVAMVVTIAVMVLWGLPTEEPKPTTTGRQVAVGQKVVLITDTSVPVNPTGPLIERVTIERWEKSLRVVINSVVFRSSGQDLTTFGTYTEMISRLAEPVLLGLAVLAVRSRVKR
ncbi:pentapeptide repeat-containing protein [Streptomyces sp. LUP30]|uniref:pentapeptide repeat-containing protein n=1 Tax=Streptomyces sp. LUP30 TaxID=1890285 RepID=UPI000B0F2679|nr:pentapeptide repeat-containing protein [Streptomyces sp. LUP30]